MRASVAFAWVALASIAGGTGFYLAMRPPASVSAPEIAPAALLSAEFHDLDGRRTTLGQFAGRPVVLNFWATWCGPCREEMPAFNRVSARMAPRVQFLGLSAENPDKVRAFARELGIGYPLWTGGDDVMELSRRLGNRMQVLPFTVILDAGGHVAAQKVGAYSETELANRLASIGR